MGTAEARLCRLQTSKRSTGAHSVDEFPAHSGSRAGAPHAVSLQSIGWTHAVLPGQEENDPTRRRVGTVRGWLSLMRMGYSGIPARRSAFATLVRSSTR